MIIITYKNKLNIYHSVIYFHPVYHKMLNCDDLPEPNNSNDYYELNNMLLIISLQNIEIY